MFFPLDDSISQCYARPKNPSYYIRELGEAFSLASQALIGLADSLEQVSDFDLL